MLTFLYAPLPVGGSTMLKRLSFPLSRQELALVGITMIWGGTFPVIHFALTICGPSVFVGCRFLAAALALGLLFHSALREATAHDIFAGVVIGCVAFMGYFLQTYGLQSISSSRSAFLTALYVPLVPLMQWLFMRLAPTFRHWIGVLFAFAGLVFMAGPGSMEGGVDTGDLATLACAVVFAGEIIAIGFFAGKVQLQCVTFVQVLTVGVLAFLLRFIMQEPLPETGMAVVVGIAVAMGLATALIQFTMNWAQKSVSPTRATLIYASEPAWGGFFGALAGDRLPLATILGAGCIISGVVISGWKKKETSPAGDRQNRAEADGGSPADDA